MNEFLDQLHEKALAMFDTLLPVTFVFMVVSLWSSVANGNRSATMYLRALAHLIVVALLLSQFVNWSKWTGKSTLNGMAHESKSQRSNEKKLCVRASL